MALMGAYEYYTSIGDTENAAKWDSSKTMGDTTNPVVIREYKDFMDAEAQYNIDSLYRAFLQVADIDFSKNEYTRLSISKNYPSIYITDYYDFNGYKWTNIISRMNPDIDTNDTKNTADPEYGYLHMPCAVKFKMRTDIEVKKLKIQNFIVTDSDFGSCICFHSTYTDDITAFPTVTINDPFISMVLNTRRQKSGAPSVFLANADYSSSKAYRTPSLSIQNMFFKVSGLANINTATTVESTSSKFFGSVLSHLIYNLERYLLFVSSGSNSKFINLYDHFYKNFKLIDSTICYNDLIMNFSGVSSKTSINGVAIIPCIPKTSCLHVVGNIKAIGKLYDTNSGMYVPHLLTSDNTSDLASLFLDFTIDTSGMDSDSETFILKTSAEGISTDAELKNSIYVNSNKFNQDDSNILTKRTGVNYLTDEQMKDPEYLLSIGFTCFSVDENT